MAPSIYPERYNEILDQSEREAANSAGVMNALLDNLEEAGTDEGWPKIRRKGWTPYGGDWLVRLRSRQLGPRGCALMP